MLGGTRSNLRLKEAVDRGPVHARLVVLEPQTLTRKALCSLLRGLRTGTLVGDAGDWEEAIRVLRAAKANILVATLDASGAFSPGVVRDIRAACKDVKILVLASNQEPELANAMHRAGVDGYLSMSSKPRDVVEAVEAIASGIPWMGNGLVPSAREGGAVPPLPPTPTPTRMQWKVLSLMVQGVSTKKIASKLGISVKTVYAHRHGAKARLGLATSPDLIRYVLARGMGRS